MEFLITIFEQGLIYGILALGVYITYKILDFPDLTVDGSFPLGGAVTAMLLKQGINPCFTFPLSFLAGAAAGVCTGVIHVKGKVRDLLSGIIMMTALYTVNLTVAGSNNVPLFSKKTIFNQEIPDFFAFIFIFMIAAVSKICLDLYLKTRSGYLLRAVGSNELLVTSLAKDKGNVKILGLGISNGLVALSGSVFCQQQGVFDISSGTGAMVIGLASVIVGTSLFQLFTRVFKKRFGGFFKVTTFVFAGAILYKACTGMAIRYFEPKAMKMISAIFLLGVLILVLLLERSEKKR